VSTDRQSGLHHRGIARAWPRLRARSSRSAADLVINGPHRPRRERESNSSTVRSRRHAAPDRSRTTGGREYSAIRRRGNVEKIELSKEGGLGAGDLTRAAARFGPGSIL